MNDSLYRQIHTQAISLLNEGIRLSLPIPERKDAKVQYIFLLSPSILKAPDGLQLLPPSHIATYPTDSAKLIKLQSVKPEDFGQKHSISEILGSANLPPGLNYEGYLELRRQLFAALEILIQPFAEDKTHLNDVEKRAVKAWKEIFPKLREAPLESYYRHILRSFDEWLARVQP